MNMDRAWNGDWPLDADGAWCEIVAAPGPPRPAMFLDRDGVIVDEVEYLCDVGKVALCPGIAELIVRANAAGIAVVVVTNQSGIARGLYGWTEFAAVQAEIARRLEAAGARWDAVMASPFHPQGRAPWRHPDHPARKPNPGMLLAAATALSLDLAASWILGDRATDIAAGRRAGLAGGIFVGPGYDPQEADRALEEGSAHFKVLRAKDPHQAATVLPLLVRDGSEQHP